MKNLRYCLLVFVFLTGSLSCKKSFLDVTGVTSPLYRENYVKDLNSMEEYLNGIYLEFNIYWSGNNFLGYPEYVADNLKPINEVNENIVANYKWSQNPRGGQEPNYDATNMSLDWRNNYRVIRTSSFVVEDIGKYRKENPGKADYIKAQALFFRALMHFKTVNIFAQPYKFQVDASHMGIPYITTSNLSASYSRQTVKQVYDAIIEDLNNAVALIGGTSVSDTRYVGLDAVKALLSRVYLFKADYAMSLSLAKAVCTRHPLMTVSNGYPNSLYYHRASADSEVLFQASPANAPNTTIFFGRYLRGSLLSFYATEDIAAILRENTNDIRSSWVSLNNGNWMINKIPAGVAEIHTDPNRDYYDPVIRSSEMFLTVAEAAFKTGDEATAREYLNIIRKRADPTASDVDESGEQLLGLIYKERRKELCFENFRLFDLQRLGMNINRVDVLDGAPTTLIYPSNRAVAPIPQKDVNISGLVQNPGY